MGQAAQRGTEEWRAPRARDRTVESERAERRAVGGQRPRGDRVENEAVVRARAARC